jgi:xylulokinase
VLFRSIGVLVASGKAAHPSTNPPRSEQNPSAWWTAFEAARAEAGVPERHQPAAIAVAGQQHGLVVLDPANEVIRPAKLWNDTESADDARVLVNALGPAAWAQACGSVPVASFTISKLRWLSRSEPEAFARVARVLLPHDWLTYRLTGSFVTDRGDASGTGWWSPAEGRYRPDLLDLIDPGPDWLSMLPEVLGPEAPAGVWGPSGCLVAAGTGDNMAAALGLGLDRGDLAFSFGTSGTAFTVTDSAAADATGVVSGFADATGRFLPLVCTLNAMRVSDTVARLMGLDVDAFSRLALSVAPGAGGLVVVPHFDGERTPNRPNATGTISGLRSDVSLGQLARATVEGVVCNLLAAADALVAGGAGHGQGRVFMIGGGARSPVYRQVLADLMGCPVFVPADEELVARGAAVQAAAALAGVSPAEIAAHWEQRHLMVEPNPAVDSAAIREAFEAECNRSSS